MKIQGSNAGGIGRRKRKKITNNVKTTTTLLFFHPLKIFYMHNHQTFFTYSQHLHIQIGKSEWDGEEGCMEEKRCCEGIFTGIWKTPLYMYEYIITYNINTYICSFKPTCTNYIYMPLHVRMYILIQKIHIFQ